MKNLKSKAFTLVELLVVVGIVGILAVIMLINLNPAEAQRRTRDAKRIKDLGTIQADIERYLVEGNVFTTTETATTTVTSSANSGKTACGDNWTGIDFCDVSRQPVPIDPRDGVETIMRCTQNNVDSCTGNSVSIQTPVYRLTTNANNSTYKISAQLESATNATRLTNDGGTDAGTPLRSTNWYEVFNDRALPI